MLSILPHIILAGGGLLLFVVGAFTRRSSTFLFGLALIAAVLAGAETLLISPPAPHFSGMLEVEGYGRFFTFLFSVIAVIALLFSYQYGRIRNFAGDEYYGLILFAALGMALVAGAVHWVVFFLGLEILSISLYILVAIRKTETGSTEAGLKYFIMGAVASAFLTFGIAILYAVSGSMNIARSLASGAPAANFSLVFLGLALILTGIGFKISMVPFHLWTPDVYQGAPAPVTAFLSTGSKVALFAALLRFSIYAENEIWMYLAPILWVLAALTMIIGNGTALAQSQVKRLLAYSSVAQMGYLLMALLGVKQQGASSIIFYLSVYALMDLAAFGTIAVLSSGRTDLDDLHDFRGLAYSHPWRSSVLAFSLISLAGLPPTAGFIGKFALFRAVLQAQNYILAVIGIATVIASLFYYFKVVVALFMRPADRTVPVPPVATPDRFAGAIVFILLLILGIVPEPLFAIIERALPVLALKFP